ncbi:glycosyltransferase family 2 protein [Pontibacter qinzhouensis]|uniref:glycosyltransferase family 2 protein n=1 Tax=Pontibacter qinzhouensis TaxID=2603253 RepID=UPI00164F8BC6|nr:glycosyltransferase family 2 protein [Pontibacter qinzhouensis]
MIISNPLVSIVIPLFNGEKYIRFTLESILKQSYTFWECLIVDDGSTDHSVSIAEEYVRKDGRFKIIIRNRLPKGGGSCRNLGVSNAKGKYLIFLDADDFLEPFCLKQRVREMESNPDLGFGLFKMLSYYGSKENAIDDCLRVFPGYSANYISRFIKADSPWVISCPIWRTDVINDKPFDINLARLQDTDFHLNILLNYPDILFGIFDSLPADVYYRKEQESRNRYKDHKFLDRIIESRIYFIKKYINLCLATESKAQFLPYLKANLIDLVARHTLAHNTSHDEKLQQLISSSYQDGVLNGTEYYLLKISYFTWKNTFTSKLPLLKGVFRTLLYKRVKLNA